ncbi:hypothetical protein ACQJ0K_10400 [Priestia megaterium]
MEDLSNETLVQLAKSCSENLFQQTYFIHYMQESINEIANYKKGDVTNE